MPKFVRFLRNHQVEAGILTKMQGQEVVAPIRGSFYEQWETAGLYYLLNEVKLLSPCTPTKIIGVGVNYYSMSRALDVCLDDRPLFFIKPPSSICGPGDTIRIPQAVGRVDYEVELAVVIKSRLFNVTPEEAKANILGYTCANDITAVELIKPHLPWTHAKGMDTFTPLGPVISTDVDPERTTLFTYLNNVRTQYGATADMHLKPHELIAYLSETMTLEAGDVVLTGTPPGKGSIKSGDIIKVCASGIGCLENFVG